MNPALPPDNPFARESELDFRLPPFDRIGAAELAEALAAGMAAQLAEVAAITATTEPATFDNTVVALERSGRLLERAQRVYSAYVSSLSDDAIRSVETEFAPRLAGHSDALKLDPQLFDRLEQVHRARHESGLDAEAVRLVERLHTDFVLAGARLDEAGRQRLRDLNQQIARASTTFNQRLTAAMEAAAVHVEEVEQLDGLGPDAIAAAAAAAIARGHDGGYLIPLLLPTPQPALAWLTNRALRRRLHQASVERASGDAGTGPVAVELARIRAARAALLGFGSHAELMVADQTVGSVDAMDAMLGRLVGPAVTNADAEAAVIAELAARDGVDLAAWDWAYYAEQVRAERFSLDAAALRPFFALERVLFDGVFFAATGLYGITFTERTDLPRYHPDVRIWKVDEADGTSLGLFVADFFAREGKRGGAWMSTFVDQNRLLGTPAVVVVNLNVNRPSGDAPALLSLGEVRTLFHEFGHALHGLFSDVTYPRFSGTDVPRDFVEFPSQVNEMWSLWPQVLANYARHVETDEPLAEATAAAIRDAEQWGEGFSTTEYLGATLLDQAWHRLSADDDIHDPEAFEAAALKEAGVAHPLIPPRYRTTYFQHIFAGAYSAGYYSYIWSEVLDADTVEWFRASGGLRRENGERFRRRLLAVGGSVDSLQAFRDVVGRDADITPLLRRRGLDRPET